VDVGLPQRPQHKVLRAEQYSLLLTAVHTADELKLTGNCLKGSRPVLSLDASLDTTPQYQLMREMFKRVFSVPEKTRRLKPFIDHVINLGVVDERIWFRNYQIVEGDPVMPSSAAAEGDDLALVEIGPRFVLQPILILAGSFNGHVVWENPKFIPPRLLKLQANK
jgi:ribosome biogenesis protein BRX1